MRREMALWGAVALLVCGYLVARPAVTHETAADEAQVRALIAAGEQAIERHDVQAAMACVSRDYEDSNGLTYRALRIRVAQDVRSVPDVNLGGRVLDVQITGDEARVSYRVSVQGEGQLYFNGTLTLSLKKEPVWRYLIFRGKGWKLIGAEGYGSVLG